jgi:hypothetical protein
MLAWRLWWALNSPLVRHPVFRRTMRLADTEPRIARHLSTGVSVFLWLTLCPLACTVPLVALCAFLALPGARLATKVSATIAKDQASGLSTLLGVTPNGKMGVSWVICTVYRDGRPPDLFLTRDELFIVIFFCCIATLAFGVAGFSLFIFGTMILIISYIDFAQSLVLGGLVGIVAAYRGSGVDARLQAVAGYITLQMMVYIPVAMLGFALMGFVLGNFTPDTVLKVVMVLTALSCLLVALRETMIVALWRILLKTLNTDFSDLVNATYYTR